MDEPFYLTLRQMEMLCALADLQSFSAAAERLGVSQPSLSASIRKLETVLELELFHRTTRRVELTEAGALVLASSRLCLDEVKAMKSGIAGFKAQRSGVVRIAAPPLLATAVLPRVVAEFGRSTPDIQVELYDTGTEHIIDVVRSGHVSLGVGTFPEDLPGLSSTTILRDEAMLFCHRDHPMAVHREIRWVDIVGLPQITLGPDSSLRTIVERGFDQAGHRLQPAFQVNQISTVLGMVAQNVGVAVLPAYARAMIGHGPLVGVRLLEPVIVRNISLLHVAGRRLPPAVQTFADIIRRTIHERSLQDDRD